MKKHPLQNRTNVQIKGGGVKGLLNNVQKTALFLKGWLPLLGTVECMLAVLHLVNLLVHLGFRFLGHKSICCFVLLLMVLYIVNVLWVLEYH